MALERLSINLPTKFNGLEDYAPKELQDFILELTRRYETNSVTLINRLRDQVVVDPSILPDLSRGEASPSTTGIATSADVEGAMLEAILWNN